MPAEHELSWPSCLQLLRRVTDGPSILLVKEHLCNHKSHGASSDKVADNPVEAVVPVVASRTCVGHIAQP